MTLHTLRRKIAVLRASKPPYSYRLIAEKLNIGNAAMARQIEHGYKPKKAETRARLGLPVKHKRAPRVLDEVEKAWRRMSREERWQWMARAYNDRK
jgi:hypothetical protein